MTVNRDPEIAARDRAVLKQMLQKRVLRPLTAEEAPTAMLHRFFWREKKHKMGDHLPHQGSIAMAENAGDTAATAILLKTLRLIIDFKNGQQHGF